MKIVVAHPGRQHSFRVAKALKDAGLLYAYVTTVYNKDSSLLMKLVKSFLGKDNLNRANKRKCPSLSDNDVVQFCELEGLLLLALYRIDHKNRWTGKLSAYISAKFQRKLAKYIIDNDVDMVISYDVNSRILFQLLKDKATHVVKVMDNAHPNRHFLYENYQENWDATGVFSRTLESCGYLTDKSNSEIYGIEARSADFHIVASSYSEDALKYEGISSDHIFKIPYGVDENKFIKPEKVYGTEPIKVLFIGEVNQRKGIKQILDAAKRLHNKGFEFNIVGQGYSSAPDLYSKYNEYVNFWGRVSFENLLKQLSTNHVFVFPTMGEGFGLVILEAMAAGLPVITTQNCGGKDVIVNGENGFLIPVGNSDAIIEKLEWLKNNPEHLQKMSHNAVECAKQYTWLRYEQAIVKAVNSIFEISKR